ncbi:MAG TPA: peptidoglycan-binding domain-containing protein [Mesorhizobium sp.]|nr:peptidoglycan-binding domain-containing protein [Mesorhizobium sp.]
MARSVRRRKKPDHLAFLREGAVSMGAVISRNPVLVGGSTAFLVALSFVSANALWYQPHFHSGVFFQTRDMEDIYVAPNLPGTTDDPTETTIRIQREPAHIPQPKPDPVIEQVQGILRDLNFYDGTVDGIAGPNTRSAIANYRKKVGLPASDRIDEELLTQLGAAPTTAAIRPTPSPRETSAATAQADQPDALVTKIQAGLKAFGNDDIKVDGVIGARTRSAIREFQSLFGLPVTGEPDATLYAKMREIGLTN